MSAPGRHWHQDHWKWPCPASLGGHASDVVDTPEVHRGAQETKEPTPGWVPLQEEGMVSISEEQWELLQGPERWDKDLQRPSSKSLSLSLQLHLYLLPSIDAKGPALC